MLEAGARLLERAAGEDGRSEDARRTFTDAAGSAARPRAPTRWSASGSPRPRASPSLIEADPHPQPLTEGPRRTLRVERTRAGRGSWYEFFPRSEGARQHEDGSWTSGTFRTAAKRLPAIAEMGFDVVYIPPIHPIGRTIRKGPNNTLDGRPERPGLALGDRLGGGRPRRHPPRPRHGRRTSPPSSTRPPGSDLEIALDLALQASPDHPWVTEHPELFTTLPDGSIAYAENPPKKYQDIYPLNFDNDPEGSYLEMRRIFQHWIDRGIRIFRDRQPAHEAARLLGVAAARREQRRTPTWSSSPRRSPGPPMMHGAREGRVPAVRTRTSPGGTRRRSSTEFLTELVDRVGRLPAAEPLRQHPRHPHRRTCSSAARPPTRSARRSPRPPPRPGASTPATSCTRTSPGRGPRRTSTTRSTSTGRATGRRRRCSAAPSRPYLTRLNAIRREHPALGQLRNIRFHWSDDDAGARLQQVPRRRRSPTPGAPTRSSSSRTSTRTAAARRSCTSTPRCSARTPGETFAVHDLITGSRLAVGHGRLRPPRPVRRAGAHPARRVLRRSQRKEGIRCRRSSSTTTPEAVGPRSTTPGSEHAAAPETAAAPRLRRRRGRSEPTCRRTTCSRGSRRAPTPDPHSVLGQHPAGLPDADAVVIRALRPLAREVVAVLDNGARIELAPHRPRRLAGRLASPGSADYVLETTLRRTTSPGRRTTRTASSRPSATSTCTSSARAGTSSSGTCSARTTADAGVARESCGTAFAVWAPHAQAVRVIGDFNGWNGVLHAMRRHGRRTASGSCSSPTSRPYSAYKFEILTAAGEWIEKADPMARHTETPPATASVVDREQLRAGATPAG